MCLLVDYYSCIALVTKRVLLLAQNLPVVKVGVCVCVCLTLFCVRMGLATATLTVLRCIFAASRI